MTDDANNNQQQHIPFEKSSSSRGGSQDVHVGSVPDLEDMQIPQEFPIVQSSPPLVLGTEGGSSGATDGVGVAPAGEDQDHLIGRGGSLPTGSSPGGDHPTTTSGSPLAGNTAGNTAGNSKLSPQSSTAREQQPLHPLNRETSVSSFNGSISSGDTEQMVRLMYQRTQRGGGSVFSQTSSADSAGM